VTKSRRRTFRLIFIAYIVFGIALLVLLARASPFAIGEGRFEGVVRDVERYDFKWWIVGGVLAAWLLPISGVVLVESARARGLDRERLRAVIREMLEKKSIPVIVDVDTRLPITLEGPLEVGVKLDTNIDLDDRIEIDASIPVAVELPIDTEVATSVFGIGSIKIPIRARVPLNITLPLKTSVGIRAKRLPIHVEETARVALPVLEVPIKSRLETRVDLLSTLESSEEVLKRG
jgi:hypothetical protein